MNGDRCGKKDDISGWQEKIIPSTIGIHIEYDLMEILCLEYFMKLLYHHSLRLQGAGTRVGDGGLKIYADIKNENQVSLPQLRFGVQHYVNFTTPGDFIRLSNIGRRMKSISELVIGKQ